MTAGSLCPLRCLMRDAATLREALQAAIRYMRLHTDVFLLSLEEGDDLAVVKAELIGSRLSHVRQIMEMAIGAGYPVMRQLLGSSRQTNLLSRPQRAHARADLVARKRSPAA